MRREPSDAGGIAVLRPVGTVRCAYTSVDGVPAAGGPAEIIIDASVADALDGLERCTHIIVLAYLHEARRDVLRDCPRKHGPGAVPRGVFAMRTPTRPNPVALTVVRLVARDGRRLTVDGLDLVDGTPIIDIKPYCPGLDAVFSATREGWGSLPARTTTDAREILESDLRRYVGEAALHPDVRATLAAVLLALERLGVDPRDAQLEVSVSRAGPAIDALMGLCGASFANGRLMLRPADGPLAFHFHTPNGCLALTVARPDVLLEDDSAAWLRDGLRETRLP